MLRASLRRSGLRSGLRSIAQCETKVLTNTLDFHSGTFRSKTSLAEAASAFPVNHSNINTTLADAISSASSLVQPRKPIDDPFSIVSKEMSTLATNIGKLLGSSHPTLNKVAMYYFNSEGKHIRPLVVLLLSKTLAEIPLSEKDRGSRDESDVKSSDFSRVDDASSPLAILHSVNPNVVLNPLSRPMDAFPSETDGILPKQRRLAEIVEMIHTASLLHDDVIDNSTVLKSITNGNTAFGNKMAILAGDFLLGRASVAIARLRNAEVIELLSTTIANLVEGEFMQLKNSVIDTSETTRADFDAYFDYYIHKSYLKTASLMSKSCRATGVLSGARQEVVDACYNFGRDLGLCFQIIDDMIYYSGSANSENVNSSNPGLTAPVLFAWKKFPEVEELIRRNFSEPGDLELARKYIDESDSLKNSRDLAQKYANDAINALMILPNSDAREALINITNSMVNRKR